jgi:hypothetical protein
MAEITFGTYSTANLLGSGLGFYGNSFGSSVQLGEYQSRSYITNSAGTTNGGDAFNTKYTHAASGFPQTASGIPLVRINSYHRTLDINFDHNEPVFVQNAQLRIYDRNNINNPASGVNTKVAEIINFNGLPYASWVATPGDANTANDAVGGSPYGSGDLFWWGSPWPAANVSRNYYENSVGVRFYNGRDSDAAVNGDARLTAVGSDETVGGTGLIVPLTNSPGSGGRFLDGTMTPGFKPKWMQYYNNAAPLNVPNLGAPSDAGTYGGTGVDRRHTWRVSVSSTPATVGSKLYALQMSIEYL